MRKTIGIVMIFALMLTLSAGVGVSKTYTVTIGWCPPDITGVFKTATDFMEKAAADAKKAGIDVKVITHSPTSHTAIGDQVKIIENFIQSKVDVIVVSPAEVEAVKPALREVNQAGIPLILVNMLTPLEGINVASFIGFDNQQAASVSAYALLDALGGPGVLGKGKKVLVKKGEFLDLKWWENVYKDVAPNSIKGKVAIIEGIAGDFFSNERLKGFHAVVDKFPGIKITNTLPADWNRQKGIKAAENILQSNPQLDAIWAASNEMGMGAYIAGKNAGREKKVMIFTNDGTPESLDYIRQGKLVAETWHGFPEWGWYGTKFAVMLAMGEKVPQFYDIRPRTEYKANADDFYPNPKLDPINWEEIKNAAK
ncbi:MAG: sugar ABC transporter substrate-binding protein [Bacteroidota bacterium]